MDASVVLEQDDTAVAINEVVDGRSGHDNDTHKQRDIIPSATVISRQNHYHCYGPTHAFIHRGILAWLFLLLAVVASNIPACGAFSIQHTTHTYNWKIIATRNSCMIRSKFQATSNKDNEDTSEDTDDSASSLSDEELLLACRAFLQKKNKLGLWTQAEERKEKKRQQQQLAKGSTAGGFFWDDPAELKYYDQNKNRRDIQDNDTNITTSNNEDLPNDDDWMITGNHNRNYHNNDDDNDDNPQLYSSESTAMSSSRLEQVTFDFRGDSDDDQLEHWSKEFSGFADEASVSFTKRSQASKPKWQDPVWKAEWYEKRWGAHNRNKDKDKSKKKKITSRDSPAFSMPFMNSPEFNALTEEEVEQAAMMYQQANARRGKSIKKALREQKELLLQHDPQFRQDKSTKQKSDGEEQQRLPRDALFMDRNNEEARQKRSERAAKAYQTRLQNQLAASNATKTGTTTSKQSKKSKLLEQENSRPLEKTPKAALVRIKMDLNQDALPDVEDLILIASPTNLGGRKELMRRLLAEQFGLRGKCIPHGQDPEKKLFLTQCGAQQVMDFAIAKVKESKREGEGGDTE